MRKGALFLKKRDAGRDGSVIVFVAEIVIQIVQIVNGAEIVLIAEIVLVAEVFPEQGNALVASASTMATVVPTEDWLQAAAKRLRDGVCGYVQGFRYNEAWHDLHGKEKKQ